jgi:iron complex outermembrane receptor protein
MHCCLCPHRHRASNLAASRRDFAAIRAITIGRPHLRAGSAFGGYAMIRRHALQRLLLGSTGLTLLMGGVAQAQDVLETVIVTAEKQATDIQKTSVSITAIQPDSVTSAGQSRLEDALAQVASVNVYRGPNNQGAYFIRGVGTTQGTSSTLELVDGVNVNPYIAEAMTSTDAERIEVLRGPQGTLYGRGAFGGLVNVITNDPTDKYEGKIFVEGGSYNAVKANAVVNIPLSDDVALRVAAFSDQVTGYMHPDGRGNTDLQLMRGKLQYKPSEDFRFQINGSLLDNEQMGSEDALPQSTRIANFASPAFGGFNPCGGDPHPNKYDPWHSPPKYYQAFGCTVPAQPPVNPSPVTGVCQTVSRIDESAYDVGFVTDYDMGWSTLTVLGNEDQFKYPLGPFSANPFLGTSPGQDLYTNIRDKVVEARLASEAGDWLKWVGGVYWEAQHYQASNINHTQNITVAQPLGQSRKQDQHQTDKSVYGQVTVPVVDRFRVIGGLRYAQDEITAHSFNLDLKTLKQFGTVGNADYPYHKLIYKAGVEFDITPDNMFYANTSTGYRPTQPAQDSFCVGKTSHHVYLPNDGSGVVGAYPVGGCTTSGAGATAVGGTAGEATTVTVENLSSIPDFITAYEGGFKNRFFDNKFELNLDAFYYKFRSLAVTALSINHVNQQATLASAETGAKAWGPELEATWLVTDNDKVTLNLTYEESESGISPFASPNCFNFGVPTHPGIVLTSTNIAACAAKNLAANPATVNWVRFREGVAPNTPMYAAPRWNGDVSYQHVFDLASGASVTASATVHFQSSQNASPAYYVDGFNAAYHETNLQIVYNTSDGKWQLAAWVNNLENHAVNAGAQSSGSGLDYIYPTYAPPRMWGVNLQAKF